MVPDLASLGAWLEWAWRDGWDVDGAEQLGWRAQERGKWIGATECAALLRAQGLRARVVDFIDLHQGGGRLEVRLAEWIVEYFEGSDGGSSEPRGNGGNTDTNTNTNTNTNTGTRTGSSTGTSTTAGFTPPGCSRVRLSRRSPLYFQHDGHSRTIIGIERVGDRLEDANLLILDPWQEPGKVAEYLADGGGVARGRDQGEKKTEWGEKGAVDRVAWAKKLKRPVTKLKRRAYQLVYLESADLLAPWEAEAWKTIRSERVTV